MRGCLFFLLFVLVAALAVMQCPGMRQSELAEDEIEATAPPPPPPDTPLPVLAELGVGGESRMVVRGRVFRFGVSAISVSGSDAIVVAWVEPKGSARESYSLRTDAARSSATAGPVMLKLTGFDRAPGTSAEDDKYVARLEMDVPASAGAPDTSKSPGGNH